MAKTVLLFSGGLPATVLLWELLHRGLVVEAVTVDYGQPARAELIAAGKLCRRAGIEQHLIQIPNLHHMLAAGGGSFPGRRTLLLGLASAFAASFPDFDTVAYAERIDTGLPEFHHAACHLLQVNHRGRLNLYVPYHERTMASIIDRGRRLHVPLRSAWSCWRSGAVHCGRCRGCVQRQRGFTASGWPDPTNYQEQADAGLCRLRAYYGPDRFDEPDLVA